MNKYLLSAVALGFSFTNIAYAATPIDLHKHSEALQLRPSHIATALSFSNIETKQIRKDEDINHTTHIRIQQTYAGIPVLGAVAIVHQPAANKNHFSAKNNTSADGIIYNNLQRDLAKKAAPKLDNTLTQKALDIAKNHFAKYSSYKDESVKVVIYVDRNNEAQYGLLATFYVDDFKTGAHRPSMLINTDNMQIVRQADVVKYADYNERITPVVGIGGNPKTGYISYDGLNEHLAPISMTRNFGGCILKNDNAQVEDVTYENIVPAAECIVYPGEYSDLPVLSTHASDDGHLIWPEDSVNGGYSPSLDALYDANVVVKLFNDWYDMPVLTQDDNKTPLKLIMRVHYGRNYGNAFWDGKVMTFGDGDEDLYPLTSLEVAAHEIAHGFTQQHANLDVMVNEDNMDQMLELAALNESFSDMASAAATYYTTGKNNWALGGSIMKKQPGFRYMDDPKKDGDSINNYNDNHPAEPHALAGVFNRAFYLIATSPNWDTHKAFDVMVEANRHYWTGNMKDMIDAACGVMSATKALNHNEADVKAAFAGVGIDVSKC